jgi:O-antigen/teichoic acid export membrane protein
METGPARQDADNRADSLVRPIGAGTVIRNFFWTQTTYLLTIVTGILVARILGPHERGLLAAAVLWPGTVAFLGVLGMPLVLGLTVRRDPQSLRDIGERGFGTAIPLGLVEAMIFAILMPFVIPTAAKDVVWWSILYLAIIPLSHAGWVAGSLLRAMGWYTWAGFSAFLNTAGYCVALLVFWSVGRTSFQTALISLLIGIALSASFSAVFVHVRTRLRRPKWSPGLLRAGAPFLFEQAVQVMSTQLIQLLILALLDPTALGYYVIAASYAGVGMTLANAMNEILFYKFAEKEPGEAGNEAVASAFRRTLIFQWIPFAAMASVACFAIPFAFGHSYGASVVPAVILAVSGSIKCQTGVLMMAMRVSGRVVQCGLLGAIPVAILCITAPMGIIKLGLAGCAWAFVFSYCFEHLAILWYFKYKMGLVPQRLYQVRRKDFLAVFDHASGAVVSMFDQRRPRKEA